MNMKEEISAIGLFVTVICIVGGFFVMMYGYEHTPRKKVITYENVEKVGEGTGKTTKRFAKGFIRGLFKE